jgi:hypothetical protein
MQSAKSHKDSLSVSLTQVMQLVQEGGINYRLSVVDKKRRVTLESNDYKSKSCWLVVVG